MPWCVSTRTLQLFLLFIVVTSFSFNFRTVFYYLSGRDGISPGLSCTPRKHLVFLKTHKTASSTILNILYRYGETRNLTFALPLTDHLGYPQRFKASFIKNFAEIPTKEYNIICNHMRFYLPEVRKVMPNGAFYFSIIRNPIQLAESSFAYFHTLSSAFRKAASLDEFLSDTARFYKRTELNSHYARNLMWFDFGHDNDAEDAQGYGAATIRELELAFDLILVSEYFDESLVLLKEALCWQMDDMVYFKLNAQTAASVTPLDRTAAEKAKAWNSLDWKLYRHFNASFWRRVAAYGPSRMKRDVARLRELCRRLSAACLRNGRPVASQLMAVANLRPPQSGKAEILGYVLRDNLTGMAEELCRRMVTPESHYLHLLQKKQSLSRVARSPTRRLS